MNLVYNNILLVFFNTNQLFMVQPKPLQFVDIGVNLTNNRFDKDRTQVLERAFEAGVTTIIITGTNARDSQQAYKLALTYKQCYATAGCHPHDAETMTEADFDIIKALHQHEKIVAVGECGLDFNRNFSSADSQIRVFRQQLKLACELKKPLFLHERDASDTMLEMLWEYQSELPPAVIHCFTGSQQALEQYLELGLYIGITGWICDERRGGDLQHAIKSIPVDRIMLETDAPYLLPRDLKQQPAHKRRNEPCYLPHICESAAKHMGIDHQQLANAALDNTRRFFVL